MSDNPEEFDAEKVAEIIAEAEKLGAEALIAGDLDSAERVFMEILELLPKHALGHYGMGRVVDGRGDVKTAERHFKDASRLAPEWIAPWTELGRIYFLQGRLSRAVKSLGKVLEIEPGDTNVRYLYASALQRSGKDADFEAEIRTILLTDSHHSSANNDLGCLLIQRNDLENGLKALAIAASVKDAPADFKVNYANALMIGNLLKESINAYTSALETDPGHISALIGLATAQRRTGNLEDALLNAEKAQSLHPELPAASNLVGTIYRELGQFEEAKIQFKSALDASPEDASARTNLGLLELLEGDWKAGWHNVEARIDDPNYSLPWSGIRIPTWDGGDLGGKSILLLSEQGYGDTIQFARFVKEIAEKADKVHLAVQPELSPLLDHLAKNVTRVEPETELIGINCCALLMSVPMHLGITGPDGISGASYISAPKPKKAITAALGEAKGLKVGLNWQGSPDHKEDFKRSIAFDMFTPLLNQTDVTFVNLSIGNDADEQPDGMIDVGAHIEDFNDSAALVQQLDLVISVDTATVHLAGALGKPCWALIPDVPDWRWGLVGDTTPWYDSVRLYRQATPGDWQSVIAKIANDLGKLC